MKPQEITYDPRKLHELHSIPESYAESWKGYIKFQDMKNPWGLHNILGDSMEPAEVLNVGEYIES